MTSNITFPSRSGGEVPAYLVRTTQDQVRPGIVLLQEIFGINANMRATAEHLTTLGYDVIVPDLFWRQESGIDLDPASAEDRERATGLLKGLDHAFAVVDALDAAAYLTKLPKASGKVGAVGYCLGGKIAFLSAAEGGIDAAVSYYGVAIQSSLDRAEDIRVPLLLHIAGDDHLCPPNAQKAIHDALGGLQNVVLVDHPGVGHAFARKGGASLNVMAAEKADRMTAEFLRSHLDGRS